MAKQRSSLGRIHYLSYAETGTPQGGVISPILANIFLHHVPAEWFINEVQPRMRGRCFIVRFADDFVPGFECESDARRVMEVLPKRFERYKLTVHPQKTALVRFGKPVPQGDGSGNGTFNFPGFTRYWTKSRFGNRVIKRKTMAKRQKRAMKAIRATWWQKRQPVDSLRRRRFRKISPPHYNAIPTPPPNDEDAPGIPFIHQSVPVRNSARGS